MGGIVASTAGFSLALLTNIFVSKFFNALEAHRLLFSIASRINQ
jgi:hypothetical protein